MLAVTCPQGMSLAPSRTAASAWRAGGAEEDRRPRTRVGPEAIPDGLRLRILAAEVREPLEELSSFARRGLIDGGSATAGRKLPPREEPPTRP